MLRSVDQNRLSAVNAALKTPMKQPDLAELEHANQEYRMPNGARQVGVFDPNISDGEFEDLVAKATKTRPVIELDDKRRLSIDFYAKVNHKVGEDMGLECHEVKVVLGKTGKKVVTVFPMLRKE